MNSGVCYAGLSRESQGDGKGVVSMRENKDDRIARIDDIDLREYIKSRGGKLTISRKPILRG
jgi:hypothetical protein